MVQTSPDPNDPHRLIVSEACTVRNTTTGDGDVWIGIDPGTDTSTSGRNPLVIQLGSDMTFIETLLPAPDKPKQDPFSKFYAPKRRHRD